METPTLYIVPPTPHIGSSTKTTPSNSRSNSTTPRPGLATGDTSSTLDTVTSNSTSTTGTEGTGRSGRSSSEKTAVNIYSMYGGRDSLAMTNGTGTNSLDGRYSVASDDAYETPAESPQERQTKSPTPVPSPTIHLNGNGHPPPPGQGQDIVTSSGRNSPAIIINPPPRRSSRQSLHSKNSIANSISKDQTSRPSSATRPSSSIARPSLSPSVTPTPLSSEPSTSRTSSSAPTIPKHPLPQHPNVLSPLASMAPSPAPDEDPDSYYIRATYAALDVSGVRGDGWEDGQELTRARLGSGKGVLPSPFAPTPDTAERLRRDMDGGKDGELADKEKELLGMVDRYGFFSPPSENRIVLLRSAPLKVKIALNKASTSTAVPDPPQLKSQPEAKETLEERQKEDRRIAKWGRMLVPTVRDSGGNVARWGFEARKERKLEERVYKGIPDRWRAAAWFTMIEAKAVESSKKTGIDVKRFETLGVEYRDAIDLPSTFDIQIDLDVPRTISGHVMFKTR